MSAMVLACLGGWCQIRDRCQHYHAEFRGQPSERLCIPGQDGRSDLADVQVSKQHRVIHIATPADPAGSDE